MESKIVLQCGHEYNGQARCGLCDRCWACCACGARKDSESRRAEERARPPVAAKSIMKMTRQNPEEGTAEIIDRRSRFGRCRLVVLCCCGAESEFYEWSWAGNGKARCSGCKKWIRRVGLSVSEK